MKKLLFFLSLLLVCGVQIYADVPKKLNIQGKLTSDSGQVLAEKSFSAALHLRPAGSSASDNLIDTKAGTTDSNGLYNVNFDVTNFNYSEGADFKVVITVESQVISTAWSSIATNPYTFYASTASYAKILDPNQTDKLVDGNFNPSVIYKINVTTAVAVSTASYTPGNAYVWGIGTNGVQRWTNPDIQVSTAAYAINAGTATYSNASSYSLNSATATYATTIANGSVTTLKVADANITPAKLTQSDYVNVYKIKVDTATYALTATTAAYVSGSGLPDGSVTTIKIADTNVTPAKLQQGGGVLYNILVSTANLANLATSATTAATAVRATSMTVSGGGANLFWGYDSGGTVQTWRSPVAAGNGLSLSGTTLSVSTGTGLGFSGTTLIVTTAPYATGAGTASTVVDGAITSAKIGSYEVAAGNLAASSVIGDKIANGAVSSVKISTGSIYSHHFAHNGDYDYMYNIKVATAVYAETAGADLAEMYASSELLAPGDVVSIDVSKDNAIVKTKTAEDTLVAGVISTKPGLLMNKTEKGYELALVGKVPTKVCNEGGSIKRGDMLVSASMAGYAKKAGDNPKTGTVIGKALENFDSVTGTILVLVNLQ